MAVIAKQRYKLDIAPKGGWVIVYASQHDNGAREIEFEITNQGNAFSIPASINVSVQGIKSNKSYFSHSCSYSGSIVTMALADDMTDVIGKVICVLKFTNQSNQKLATAKFVLNVDTDSSSEGVIIDTEAEEIFNQMLNDIRAQAASISADIAELQSMVGSPLVASTVSAMTDHNKIYVYTGSESGHTNGNWYYWNGSAWTSGGVYNSTALETDSTLTQPGQAADAKVVGDEIDNLKSALTENPLIEKAENTSVTMLDFVHGGVNINLEPNFNTSYRIITKNYIVMPCDVVFSVNSGYRFSIVENVNGTLTSEGWKYSGDTQSINAGTMVRIQIGKGPDDTSATADINTFASNVLVTSGLVLRENATQAHISVIENNVENVAKLKEKSISFNWEIGSIGANGANARSNYAIRSDYADISIFNHVNTNILNGYRYGWHFYDSTKTHIESSTSWNYSTLHLAIPSGAVYVRFNISLDRTTESSTSWASNLVVKGDYAINEEVNKLSLLSLDSFGSGSNTYYGDKVKLVYADAERKCNISLWKDFLGAEIQDITDYAFHLNQSMAIYGDYVFCFSANGVCTILLYSSKEIVGKCAFTPNSRQHANSAQFSNYFYDDDDEFPLLFLSRCGNSATFVQAKDDSCLIYRITRSGNTFTMTLINQIVPIFDMYGSSYGIDLYNNKLIVSAYLNGTWQSSTNNPIVLLSFDMPTFESILGDSTVSLNIEDANTRAEFDHDTFQGLTVNGGLVFEGITKNGQNVWVFNPSVGKIQSKIPLTSSYEVEGVAIHNGKLYVSQKYGLDSEGTNPMKIYEIEF